MERQKRAAAIHDISCFGRCSLTVALPVLSAAGIETSVIPTAVLSTHTGGFDGFTYRDLTEDILPIVKHWNSLNLGFDAIYTGFLGSFEQIEIVMEAIRIIRGKDTLVVVDPVMADNGELYSLFPKEFPTGMRKLCAVADIIVPNMTEAALLLGEDYREPPYTRGETSRLLCALCELGPKKSVLTGVSYDGESLGAASYDSDTGEFGYYGVPRIGGMYHGTGDVFASALVAAMLRGHSLASAIRAAVDFTVNSIARSKEAGSDNRYGVNFEAGLGEFAAGL
ncbi:MAG: pyridoxamine kinase [Clostridiales Family XIII bacterium]|jgi:pyridoxine kinase|nr:pyridoxamine kinase [Clostridiales Family XIII bacterium]